MEKKQLKERREDLIRLLDELEYDVVTAAEEDVDGLYEGIDRIYEELKETNIAIAEYNVDEYLV